MPVVIDWATMIHEQRIGPHIATRLALAEEIPLKYRNTCSLYLSHALRLPPMSAQHSPEKDGGAALKVLRSGEDGRIAVG